MCKHRFGVQLFQNPPLCSSTSRFLVSDPRHTTAQEQFPSNCYLPLQHSITIPVPSSCYWPDSSVALNGPQHSTAQYCKSFTESCYTSRLAQTFHTIGTSKFLAAALFHIITLREQLYQLLPPLSICLHFSVQQLEALLIFSIDYGRQRDRKYRATVGSKYLSGVRKGGEPFSVIQVVWFGCSSPLPRKGHLLFHPGESRSYL